MFRNSQYYENIYHASKGERIAAAYFTKNGYNVQDVRKDPQYMKVDTDYLVTKDNQTLGIEVKYDGYIHNTQNLILEDFNLDANTKSWWHRITADYLVYVSKQTEDMYIVRVQDLREYLEHGGKHNISISRRANYNTFRNILVNMKDYQAAGYHIQLVKGELNHEQ